MVSGKEFKLHVNQHKQVHVLFTGLNALGDWIIGIYLHEFIVSEWVQANPDNSRAMSVLAFFVIQIEYNANKNSRTLSQPKPWCNDSGVLNLHQGYYTMIMTSRRLFYHKPVSRGTNPPIRKSEFVQCMKVE